MSETTLFKRAFVRGLNSELINSGAVQYPSQAHADDAADYIAKHASFADPLTDGENLTLPVAGELCTLLKRASVALCEDAGGYSPQLSKTASATSPEDRASQEAFALLEKVAYETQEPNTAEAAAMHDAGARLDILNRPPGYAVGNQMPTGEGEIGSERPVGDADEKMASAIARLNKIATAPAGTNTGGPNTPAVAAKSDPGAALDAKNRPAGYAVGKVSDKVPAGATIGAEVAVGPSKTAMALFNKTAALVLPYLPERMPDNQKVAHINAMGSLSTRGKALYLDRMYVAYGADKTASLAYAEAFYKKASDDENSDDEREEYEVAKALESAAENLEDQAEDHTEGHAEEVMEEKSASDAAMQRLSAAARRIAG